jgi:hypothetical protein
MRRMYLIGAKLKDDLALAAKLAYFVCPVAAE